MSTGAIPSCKACGGELGPVFYAASAVPVHACLLLDTAADALAVSRGDVQLATCQSCGTITNLRFDKRWSAYSPEYEDQQAFSPTFNSFAGRLAQDLVQRHRLEGEAVIDIGCSKGDFLTLMCNAGAARGIGIDPSVVEGRVVPPKHGQLDLIEAFYADEHLDLPAKLISNRHTLEHIIDVHEMLGRMHRHAVKAGGAITFIEVPSMTRVLRDMAFEDIYYEHCSYFTPGALARALRQAGFGVQRLWLDYGDQYLLAEAVVDPTQDKSFDIEEPVTDILEMVETFEAGIAAAIDALRTPLINALDAGQKVTFWGSGSKCISLWHAIGSPKQITSIIDINPNRWGKYVPGMPFKISEPASLANTQPDIVVAMNAIYLDEITQDLRKLGCNAQVMTLRNG
ncbi:C-methyltransferase C-terminal domain-containing protein [Yoonia tamlensis]|uniref:C-methyltransferase C-terminal domain-containing protein n=1 Tax=Yoonia tamlensis TaxID=390270 RepID=A0A1I6G9Q2_9RHOB|nr:class I SAM-dependent methyltransferase [Yoonia tamlensis]SFR38895.1 C-methyltransferase C-terminal domain-containing protein [Yoonia tamlensis]